MDAVKALTMAEISERFMAAFIAEAKEVVVALTVSHPDYVVEATGILYGKRYGIAVRLSKDLSDIDRNLDVVRLAFMRAEARARP